MLLLPLPREKQMELEARPRAQVGDGECSGEVKSRMMAMNRMGLNEKVKNIEATRRGVDAVNVPKEKGMWYRTMIVSILRTVPHRMLDLAATRPPHPRHRPLPLPLGHCLASFRVLYMNGTPA